MLSNTTCRNSDYRNLQASVSFFSTCLGNFHAFLVSVDFLKTSLFLKVLSKIKWNSLDHDQARWFVGPDLGSNCFPRYQQTALIDRMHTKPPNSKTQRSCCANITLYIVYDRISTHTCFLGNCSCFLSSADFCSKYFFFEIILSNMILCIPMSNNLYPDQARIFVEPDPGPNC